MQNLFIENFFPYGLRKTHLLYLPPTKTKTYGTNSAYFQGCLQWNSLPDSVSSAKTVNAFKQLLKESDLKCTCNLCK